MPPATPPLAPSFSTTASPLHLLQTPQPCPHSLHDDARWGLAPAHAPPAQAPQPAFLCLSDLCACCSAQPNVPPAAIFRFSALQRCPGAPARRARPPAICCRAAPTHIPHSPTQFSAARSPPPAPRPWRLFSASVASAVPPAPCPAGGPLLSLPPHHRAARLRLCPPVASTPVRASTQANFRHRMLCPPSPCCCSAFIPPPAATRAPRCPTHQLYPSLAHLMPRFVNTPSSRCVLYRTAVPARVENRSCKCACPAVYSLGKGRRRIGRGRRRLGGMWREAGGGGQGERAVHGATTT